MSDRPALTLPVRHLMRLADAGASNEHLLAIGVGPDGTIVELRDEVVGQRFLVADGVPAYAVIHGPNLSRVMGSRVCRGDRVYLRDGYDVYVASMSELA